VTKDIADTLKAHPICQQIVLFLLENQNAMDTAAGIATWWLGCDEGVAQAALDRLTACGVITRYPFMSRILYGLTRDPEIRAWLRATYGTPFTGRGNGGAARVRRKNVR